MKNALRSTLTSLLDVFPASAAVSDISPEDLANEIRVAQSVSLVRQMPMLVAGNGLGALGGCLALSSAHIDRPLAFLPLSIWLALAPMLYSWLRLRNRATPKTVSPRRIRTIVIYSGCLGALWAALQAYYLPQAPFGVASFFMAGCAFLSVGAVAALFAIPWACIAYSAPIMFASVALSALQEDPAHLAVTLLLMLMTAGVFYFLQQNWLNFTATMNLLHAERRLRNAYAQTQKELQIANEQLTALATTDGLTGLANRRRFDDALLLEWRQLEGSGRPLSLLMIDVDLFKQINDRFGHAAGDKCLRQVALAIQGNLTRESDFVARLGGDEFAAFFVDSSEAEAFDKAERIRIAVARLASVHRPTVSIGVATIVPDRASTAADALALADQALYEAKQLGRNRCSGAAVG